MWRVASLRRVFGRVAGFVQHRFEQKLANERLALMLQEMIDRGEESCGGRCSCSRDCPFRRQRSEQAVLAVMDAIEDVRCGVLSESAKVILRRLEHHHHRDKKLPSDAAALLRRLHRRLNRGLMTEKPLALHEALLASLRALRSADSQSR